MNKPESLGIIAGKGVYPRLLAESARKQGVKHIYALCFKKETNPVIDRHVDASSWIYIGQMAKMLDEMKKSGVTRFVMAGQITPTSLFTVRVDEKMRQVLKTLPQKNADTIFGAVGKELENIGIELIPASSFMESHMPGPGLLSNRGPSESEQLDIDLGIKVAKTTSSLEIGQTVVIKEGTILAVEAFEGTNKAIKRAASLGGEGIVIVKVAKQGHDMRFDIPVIGLQTMKILKKVKASALALEAGKSILLEREEIIKQADAMNLCLTAVDMSA